MPLTANVIMAIIEGLKDFCVQNWDNAIMWVIGAVLIYLAIKKEMEPTLLLPMGFGAILVNLPGSAIAEPGGLIDILYRCGIERIFPTGTFYRHRSNDRLRSRAYES